MVGGRVLTAKVVADVTDCTRYVGRREPMTLGDVVRGTGDVPAGYFIDDSSLDRWTYLKGRKTLERVSASGHSYVYTEGAVAFPNPLNRASRTVITGEGGAAPSRTKHGIRTEDGKLRRLTPEELEQLNGFPRGWTRHPGVTDARRAFLMGNALVVGIVRAIGEALAANATCEAGSR